MSRRTWLGSLCGVLFLAIGVSVGSWVWSRYATLNLYRTMSKAGIEGYEKRRRDAENIVTSGNALAAAQILRSGSFGPDCRPLLVSAFLRESRTPVLLVIDCLAPKQNRSELILAFRDTGQRNCQIAYSVPGNNAPDVSWGAIVRAFMVGPDDISKLGTQGEDGIVYIAPADIARAFPEGSDALAVPTCDVAVGLRYTDGVITNFVPMVRESTLRRDTPGVPAGGMVSPKDDHD